MDTEISVQEYGERIYSPQRWAALAVLLLGAFMDMLDATIVNIALPSMQGSLGLSGAALSWIRAGYSIAFGLLLVTGGRLGDLFGRKRIYLFGVTFFTLASLVAGLSWDETSLVIARIAQGAAAAVMVPQILSVIHTEFPPGERQKAFGMYGMTFALGGFSGNIVGALLVQADIFGLAWRPIFLINLLIACVALPFTVHWMRESRSSEAAGIDGAGVGLLTLALAALLYPLIQGADLGWPLWCYLSMAASVPLLLLFGLLERARAARGFTPLVDPALLRHRGIYGGLIVALLFFAAAGYFFVLTLDLQEGLGFTPVHAALTTMPSTVGISLGAMLSVRLVPKLGRTVVVAGSTLLAVGLVAMILAVDLGADALRSWELFPGVIVSGFGISMVSTTLVTVILERIPASAAGAASGVINTTIQIGTAAGIALIAVVFFGALGGGAGYTTATTRGLELDIALFAVAAALGLVIPRSPRGEPGSGKSNSDR